jgi:hypothetical protein
MTLIRCGRCRNAIAECDAAIAERDRLIAMNEKLRQLLRKTQSFVAKNEWLANLHPDQLHPRFCPEIKTRRGFSVEGAEKLTGRQNGRAYVDKGYRGHDT